jgi:BMFP domain-containing protein YqiC
LIKELNASKTKVARGPPQRSSSPFAPESQRHNAFRDAISESDSKLQASFRSEAANTVQSRITPLVLQKFQDLAQSYENELDEKQEAEKEARRILINTQAELANLRTSVADLESRLEADETATKTEAEAADTAKKVLAYLTHQNRIAVQDSINKELATANGDSTNTSNQQPNGQPESSSESKQDVKDTKPDPEDTPQERLRLAAELRALLEDQRQAEADYVEARGLTGTGEKIDQYRRLLNSCLPPEDQEALDENIEDMIKMMEDERSEARLDCVGRLAADTCLELAV